MRCRVVLLAALLLAPAASAGTAQRPDLRDERGDGRSDDTDILSAWLEPREEGLRFGLEMAAYDDTHHTYWVLLRFPSTGREISAIMGYGASGVLRGALTTGEDDGGLDGRDSIFVRGDFDRVANGGLVDLSVDGARSPRYQATIPWGAFDELEPGVVVEWMVGNTLYERGQWTGAADRAEPDEPFVADVPDPLARMSGGLLPILVPAWVIPLVVVLCTLAGLAGGAALAYATRAKPKVVPVATSAPVRALPPKGERFQRAPGKR